MSYPGRPMSAGQVALLMGLVSLPIVGSLIDLKHDQPSDLPSALSLGLMFVHGVTLPITSFWFAYRAERGFGSHKEMRMIRFGTDRRWLAWRGVVKQCLVLFVLGYLLSALCIVLAYEHPGAAVARELSLVAPVTLVWCLGQTALWQAVRSWAHRLGLWGAAILYPFAFAASVPLGPLTADGIPFRTTPTELLVSPFFHLAHLLGLYAQELPVTALFSWFVLGAHIFVGLGLVLVRVPR
jgi:hypothetical protein